MVGSKRLRFIKKKFLRKKKKKKPKITGSIQKRHTNMTLLLITNIMLAPMLVNGGNFFVTWETYFKYHTIINTI